MWIWVTCTIFANLCMLETSQTKIWRQKKYIHTYIYIYICQKHVVHLALQDQLFQNPQWLLISFRVKARFLPFFPSSIWPLIYLSYIPRTHCSVWPVVRTQTQNRHVCMNDWLVVSLWQILLFFSGCLNPTYMLLCDSADLAPPTISVTCLLPFVRLLKIRT